MTTDRRVTDDTVIVGANVNVADLFDLVDVSDTSDAPTGTNKKITVGEAFKAPVPRIAEVLGNRFGGVTSAGASASVGLEASTSVNNPNTAVQQAFYSAAFWTGTPGGSSGSLQGGSFASSVFNNGTGDISVAVVGLEAIATVDGNNGHKVGTAIALQTTATIQGTQSLDFLVSLDIPAPNRVSGAGTVTNAYGMRLAEPTTGTNRWAARIAGKTRIIPAASTGLEIADTNDTTRWTSNASAQLTGYASDGTSIRIVFDPADSPTERLYSNLFGSGRHFSAKEFGGDVFILDHNGDIGFHGHAAAAQSVAGSTAADAIACLKAHGLMAT